MQHPHEIPHADYAVSEVRRFAYYFTPRGLVSNYILRLTRGVMTLDLAAPVWSTHFYEVRSTRSGNRTQTPMAVTFRRALILGRVEGSWNRSYTQIVYHRLVVRCVRTHISAFTECRSQNVLFTRKVELQVYAYR